MIFRVNILISIATNFVLFVHGQATHTVTVGLEGSFFSPPSLTAGLGDTVTFVFAGDIHSVTQSSFANPCVPLPGGFNSGLAGKGTNSSAPVPTWDLHIADILQPIWFFCQATRPLSHCAAGMVGSINPPNQTSFNEFLAFAKLVSGTPAPTPRVVLTGQGAFATNSPAVPPTPVSISTPPSAPSSSTENSTTSSQPTSSSSFSIPIVTTSHLGAIVGGAVGGAFGVILICAALFWLCYRQKARNNVPVLPASADARSFTYHPDPFRRPSEAFIEPKRLDNSNSNVHTPPTIPRTLSPDHTLVPVRRGQTPPATPAAATRMVHRQESLGFDRQSSFSSDMRSTAPPSSDQAANVNIQALANEVAAALLRSPSVSNLPQQRDGGSVSSRGVRRQQIQTYVENAHENDSSHEQEEILPPPTYRTAMGSPIHQVDNPSM